MSEPVRRLSLFLFVCMAQVAPFCHGQAFNIDLGGGAGTPGGAFAAAGTTGAWHAIELSVALPPGHIFTGPELALTNRAGRLSPVTLQLFAQIIHSVHDTEPGFAGDAAALLTDGWSVPDVPGDITIRHLLPGRYRLTVYGFVGNNSAGTLTGVFGAGLSGTMGNRAWTGEYVVGHTHATSLVNVDNGQVNFGWAAGSFNDNGVITGVQLEPLPRPGTVLLIR